MLNFYAYFIANHAVSFIDSLRETLFRCIIIWHYIKHWGYKRHSNTDSYFHNSHCAMCIYPEERDRGKGAEVEVWEKEEKTNIHKEV